MRTQLLPRSMILFMDNVPYEEWSELSSYRF